MVLGTVSRALISASMGEFAGTACTCPAGRSGKRLLLELGDPILKPIIGHALAILAILFLVR